jgi:hypothetical protein
MTSGRCIAPPSTAILSQRTSPGTHDSICTGDGLLWPKTVTAGAGAGGAALATDMRVKSKAAFNMIKPPQCCYQTSAIAGAYKIEKQRV